MAGYRYSKEHKVGAGGPRSPCGGISHPPRTPQGIPRLMRPLGALSPRDWSAGRLTLTGIEPVPAEATTSPLHRDQGDFGPPWTHRAGGRSRPLATRDQDFRVLDHDRRFGAGCDREGDVGSPSGHPSTRRGGSPPGPRAARRERRGTSEARAGAPSPANEL